MLHTPRSRVQGQVIVIVALALVAVVAAVGLVIDAGAAFAQQRIAQNGSDATSTAGTVVIAQSLSGIPRSGADVRTAVDNAAVANGLTLLTAEYTDDLGSPIGQNVVATGSIPRMPGVSARPDSGASDDVQQDPRDRPAEHDRRRNGRGRRTERRVRR